jgi:proline utilization trans-activator
VVLLLASTVDYSLLRNTGVTWLNTIYAVLEEMVSRGNLIAQFYSTELHQLDENLKTLSEMPATASFMSNLSPQVTNVDLNTNSSLDAQINVSPDFLGEWNSDDGLNGDQLMALANSLNFDHFDWVGSMDFDGFQSTEPMLPS